MDKTLTIGIPTGSLIDPDRGGLKELGATAIDGMPLHYSVR